MGGNAFLRHKIGEERRSPVDRFTPATSDDQYDTCFECDEPIVTGQRVTLFAVGPVHPSDAEKADSGGFYNALAVIGHQTCYWPDAA